MTFTGSRHHHSMGDNAALIAAVQDGDLRQAEAQLEAGADTNATDADGNTMLGIAAARANAQLVELLLSWGADPNARSSGGMTPLMLAADAGALSAAIALMSASVELWHRNNEGRDALDIASRWLTVDPEVELRRRLGAADGDEMVVERGQAPDEGLGSVETIRVSTPNGHLMIQTGHAAIATELEKSFGIRPAFAELMARGLTYEDPDHIGRRFPAWVLESRGDEETFVLATAAIVSPDPRQRHFAAEVLLRFGVDLGDDVGSLNDRTVDLLRRRAADEQEPTVLERVLVGLGHHFDARAMPEILLHASHPAAEVRAAVAFALQELASATDVEAFRAVVALCHDEDAVVRRNATLALAYIQPDSQWPGRRLRIHSS
ncbi:ankyrin repeat domain-containing protein [Nocardia sp. GAS34]|uniref:ankyrin repeat domain-containing protein n=1 Tax=unclassified Nocardia TaxID=2637762 RepID=UPI003D1C5852